jgi:hypothetical protein
MTLLISETVSHLTAGCGNKGPQHASQYYPAVSYQGPRKTRKMEAEFPSQTIVIGRSNCPRILRKIKLNI